jgi:3-oxoacyl-(acyl-carrier-protein) synthase
VNAHGTGTRVGDVVEAKVIADVLGDGPWVSSTKSLNGHAQGAAGAHEAIHCLIMMNEGWLAPTVNLDNVDPDCEQIKHVHALQDARIDTAMTMNSGLGGVNACLGLARWTGDDSQ